MEISNNTLTEDGRQ